MSQEVSNQVTNINLDCDFLWDESSESVHETHTLEDECMGESQTLGFLIDLEYTRLAIPQAEQLSQLHGKPYI